MHGGLLRTGSSEKKVALKNEMFMRLDFKVISASILKLIYRGRRHVMEL